MINLSFDQQSILKKILLWFKTEKRSQIMRGDLFDFGYALTVHKAQGSQAKRVILFEERFRQMSDDSEITRYLSYLQVSFC